MTVPGWASAMISSVSAERAWRCASSSQSPLAATIPSPLWSDPSIRSSAAQRFVGERAFAVGVGIDEGEGDLGHAERLAIARAGEDHVFHLCAAQGARGLLAEHPTDGVEDVRLAAAIGADDGGHALAGQGELGAVAEGLEAEDLDLLELEHRYTLGSGGGA